MRKPSFQTIPRIIYKQELELLIGKQDSNDKSNIYLGKSVTYEQFDVKINLNDFFSNHFAILGNSGSGKSCGVARILQNIFQDNKAGVPQNAHIVLFDVYGEYNEAFKNANNIPNLGYKSYDVDENYSSIKIPAYFLDIDDLALLLNAENHSQLTIIERASKLAKIFSENNDNVNKLKNHLIASAIQSVLFSNQNASGKKNDIFQMLASCSTNEFNVNAELKGIGYTRRFANCFQIDNKGEFGESVLINEYLASHMNPELESQIEVNDNAFYNLKDFAKALDFALIGEGFLNNRIMQDSAIILKVRLNSIINSKNGKYFEFDKYISLEQYISKLIVLNSRRSQIINVNLEDIDDALAKVIVKIISKMIFDFAKKRKVRASIPFHLILEEAHRYVQNDNDKFLLGYNIFERIAKEGRKYGVIIDLISQRPVDISETVVAQMSNFLVLKMTHPKDLEYIEKMLPNVSSDIIEKLNSLQAGTLVSFGNAFKIPLLIKMDLPDPLPYSANCDVLERWKASGN